jgi:hypothetical protein
MKGSSGESAVFQLQPLGRRQANEKSFGPWINGNVNETNANRCLVFKQDRHRNRQIGRGLVAHIFGA